MSGKLGGAPNPYPGPRPFERGEGAFYGRTRELCELESTLGVTRCVLLFAASGAGKTSLLNAGLVPRLETLGYDVPPAVRVGPSASEGNAPGSSASLYVARVLRGLPLPEAAPTPTTLAEGLRALPRKTDAKGRPAPRLLIFDQFEEAFAALPERRWARREFFREVAEALGGTPDFLRPGDVRALEPLRGAPGLAALLELAPSAGPVEAAAALNRLIQDGAVLAWCDEPGNEAGVGLLERAQAAMAASGARSRAASEERLARHVLSLALPTALAPVVEGDPHLRVLFSMREESIGQIEPYIESLPSGQLVRYRIEPLDRDSARQAIEKPLVGTGVAFAPEATESLLIDLLSDDDPGPDAPRGAADHVDLLQLQIVCERLWRGLEPGTETITPAMLKASGQVGESIRRYYRERLEEALAAYRKEPGLTYVKEGALRRWFGERLIDGGNRRTRVFPEGGEVAGLPLRLVELLHARRLLRLDPGAGAYELPHDRFRAPVREDNAEWFGAFPKLEERRRWLQERADAVRKGGPLLGTFDLAAAEAWQKEATDAQFGVDSDLEAYIARSRQALRDADERRRVGNLRRQRLGFAVTTVVLGVLLAANWRSLRVAQASTLEAQNAQERAESLRLIANVQKEAARKSAETARAGLRDADNAWRLAITSTQKAEANADMAREAASKEADQRRRAEKAQKAAVAATIRTKELLRSTSSLYVQAKKAAERARTQSKAARDYALYLSYSRHRLEVVAGEERKARKKAEDLTKEIADNSRLSLDASMEAKRQIAEALKRASDERDKAVQAKKDAEKDATAALVAEGKARRAEAEAQERGKRLAAAVGAVQDLVARTPEPRALANVVAGGIGFNKGGPSPARLVAGATAAFRRGAGRPLLDPKVDLFAASPNGRTYVTSRGSRGKDPIHIYDQNGRTTKADTHALDDPATLLRVSADGRYVVAAGRKQAQVWHVGGNDPALKLSEPPHDFAAIDPEVKLVAFGDVKGRLVLREFGPPGRAFQDTLEGGISALEFLTDAGEMPLLLVATSAGTVEAHRIRVGSAATLLLGPNVLAPRAAGDPPHEGLIAALAVRVQGGVFASAGYDDRLFLWTLDSSAPVRLETGEGLVRALAFSPDGAYLVAVLFGDQVAVYDVAQRKLLGVVPGSLSGAPKTRAEAPGVGAGG